jgi:alpha-1,3-glucosyltransferase
MLIYFRSTLFTQLGVVTLATFVLLFLPWLYPPSALLDPITRIFPFARGLFEDKVANFWCASNVIIKWRSFLSPSALPKLATATTAVGFLPSMISLINPGIKAFRSGVYLGADRAPTLSLLPYALFQTSLSFFLFSFQVHEKSVLLPLLPLTLLAVSSYPGQSDVWEWGVLVNNIACFSMWPLLKRDGLGVQYTALVILWNYLVGYNPLAIRSLSLKALSLVRFLRFLFIAKLILSLSSLTQSY